MNNKVYSKVFMWLFIGLLITFALGFGLEKLIENNTQVANIMLKGYTFLIVIIAELVLAIFLGIRATKMNPTLAKICFILYSALTGVAFSALFMHYELGSISIIFLVTGVLFGVFALIGSKLDVDLSKFGIFLLISLIGVLIVEIINIFIGSSMLAMILSAVVILIFTLYIGYDIQKVKEMSESGINEDNIAIAGAFQLYLDFINIFIRLLELFGKAKD